MLIPNYYFYTNFNHFDCDKLNVPSSVDSVGVNSKEKYGIFTFFTILASLNSLISEMIIMSQLMILVDLIKYSRSSKVLFKEQVLM